MLSLLARIKVDPTNRIFDLDNYIGNSWGIKMKSKCLN